MMKTGLKRKIAGTFVAWISLLTLLGCGSGGNAGTQAQTVTVNGQQSESGSSVEEKDSARPSEVVSGSNTDGVTKGAELLCLAESEDEARKVAQLYGIEFVDFSYGVATFHTEDDPQKVIDMGKEKGYPELSINGESKLEF